MSVKFGHSSWRGCAAAVFAFLALFGGQPAQAHDRDRDRDPDVPTFSKNYFVTGDYLVTGVGLRGKGGPDGFANGKIIVYKGDVPTDAEPVAAFLYWESVVSTHDMPAGLVGAKFNGHDIAPLTKILNPDGSSPCWSAGGATGTSNGTKKTLLHRADVLRFLSRDTTGRLVAPGEYSVRLADTGKSGKVPIALGATLLMIYRTASAPLRSVVLYEGGFEINEHQSVISQTLAGFYQASSSTPAASLSVIVGNGSAKFSERLLFNNKVIATNPFVGALGGSWDNPTYAVTLPRNASSATVRIEAAGKSYDCVSGGAFILSTAVQDADGDGLIDAIEDGTLIPLKTPDGEPLPDLHAMGAGSDKKDLFIEVGALAAAPGTKAAEKYGSHTHLPSPKVLKLVGDAFRDAPGDDAARVHFDMGPNYNPIDGDSDASPYVMTSDARGGEIIAEAACVSSATLKCQFPDYPGTVSF